MTTNFTLRDFFVYLLTGLTLIICVGTIFIGDIFKWTAEFFSKYEFIKDFSFLVTIFIVPAIYLLGHIIGSLSYNSLQIYTWLYKRPFFKKERSKWKHSILMTVQKLLYRQRISYAIIEQTRTKNGISLFANENEFWTICAKLQIEKIYAPAEYWYILNELFNSINLVFFISTIISFMFGNWIVGVACFFLTIFAFKRARQYADHFVKTIVRTSNARNSKWNSEK
jgi:hypothetical protein